MLLSNSSDDELFNNKQQSSIGSDVAEEEKEEDIDDLYGPPTAANTDHEMPPNELHQKKQAICDCFTDQFKVGTVYTSPKVLCSFIEDHVKQYHFSVRRQGYAFVCARAMRKEKKDENYVRKRDTKSFKIECPFRVNFNYADSKKKHEVTEADGKGKKRYSEMVKITSVCGMHGPDCDLNVQELQAVLKRGGLLSKF
jgi:hypothetical protein